MMITILITLLSFFSLLNKETPTNTLESEKPNIILIFADDMAYGDLGSYGARGWETPHLDQLSADGLRFTQFYVPHAVCTASRAALLTGAYANRLGLYGALDHTADHGLNPEEITIAEMLKENGYQTGMVGKWHLGHHPEFLPTRQGFDSYFGLPYSNDMWPKHPESKNYYPPLPLIEGEKTIAYLDDQQELTSWYTYKSLEFIEKNQENPFFLYLAHSMPHVPLFVSDKFKGKSEQGLYGDVMMEIDWSVGEIRKKLKELGLSENTLIIFTSDNGPWLSYGGHAGLKAGLKEGKGTSWEGGIRVPAIFSWPGKIPAGQVQNQAAMTIDILPTLAKLTNSNLPKLKIDGSDIWPLIQGEEQELKPYYAYYNQNELQAVIYGKWKLVFPHVYRTIPADAEIRNDGIPVKYSYIRLENSQLFDLSKDMEESLDVSAQNPEIAAMLNRFAAEARADMGDALTKTEGSGNRKVGRQSQH
ncbi:C-terminal region of aryl-sulfatase [Algoriphagus alkaliphilus]|uniref:C-terminal region of aryl-sulfatase n=2 Tax=Algoriphagus alkaliphilus TaxID=279824 RepID=A0A1G5XH89_9BACT|nr:C-terminal region of aryl-sulfatase [Algoriphagus alkaliphilus]